jgi:hypothetical protein
VSNYFHGRLRPSTGRNVADHLPTDERTLLNGTSPSPQFHDYRLFLLFPRYSSLLSLISTRLRGHSSSNSGSNRLEKAARPLSWVRFVTIPDSTRRISMGIILERHFTRWVVVGFSWWTFRLVWIGDAETRHEGRRLTCFCPISRPIGMDHVGFSFSNLPSLISATDSRDWLF